MSDPDDYIHDEVPRTWRSIALFAAACVFLLGGITVRVWLDSRDDTTDLTPCYDQPRAETDGGELVAVPCEEKR